jgi:hypothetical protein
MQSKKPPDRLAGTVYRSTSLIIGLKGGVTNRHVDKGNMTYKTIHVGRLINFIEDHPNGNGRQRPFKSNRHAKQQTWKEVS